MKNINTSNKRYVFIGGKQIGVDCLMQLLDKKTIPELVIVNMDDDGKKDNWHASLLKLAVFEGLNVIHSKKVSDTEVIGKIREINPEIIFCIGGTQIIPDSILKIPRLGCLNIHPAFLPKYRGRYSTAHAIFNGEKYTGVTIHWMDKGIDTGPIIIQEKIEIEDIDTAKSLYDKFTLTGGLLFGKFLDMWLNDKEIVSYKQNENEATYYSKQLPGGGEIDWSWNGEKIKRFIRSMTFEPFPPPQFKIGKKKMVIVDEKCIKKTNDD